MEQKIIEALSEELKSIAECIEEYYENNEDDIPIEDLLGAIQRDAIKVLKKYGLYNQG